MPEPVLVVHGVANRDEPAFEALVADLGERLRLPSRRLVPVYWGDLGAKLDGLADTIPGREGASVRAPGAIPPEDAAAALGLLAGPDAAGVRAATEEARAQIAGDGFEQRARTSPESLVRAEDAGDLRVELEQAWVDSSWLKLISDEALLKELGAAAAEGVGLDDEAVGDSPVRALGLPDVRTLVRRVVGGLDRAVGAVIGAVGGELNSYVRAELAPNLGAFIGDVFVYQRHRNEIHDRVREVIARDAPGYGEAGKPIPVIAHSLGGVIGFDMAIAGEPRLSISELITFGSQSPFFHILDPRGGGLPEFRPGTPSPLPDTIGGWTNLWEPLDPLAFIAAKVFKLSSRALPSDRQLHHLASSKLWTHSAYWRSQELLTAARDVLS